MNYEKEALEYHSLPVPGKLSVIPSKPCITQRDLSLAYTPGVAAPCMEIFKDPYASYNYTNRGNLVAVVSNGTAVLGLGNIGAAAGKPVMEGKGVLFKRFAGVDVFDIELDTLDADEIIRICEVLAPTFGGINLEDIRAPECFRIEEKLKQKLDIPVFHDDQHGTAIISGAALLNALEINGKNIAEIKVVMSGAGAAGIACARFYETLGVLHENLLLVDSTGVIYEGREDVCPDHLRYNPYKAYFAQTTTARTLADACQGADFFAGASVADIVTQDMVRSMAEHPIVFAMANPDPEISYEDALAARKDVIVATGRSDYPNQVNNVLGFPFIFRGALDVRAKAINEEMKVAAARALAALAKEDVPDSVLHAYDAQRISFGREYFIPKPLDPRILIWEAVAVAKAAVESGVAQQPIEDWEAYRDQLERYLGAERETVRRLVHRAQQRPMRIAFAEGDNSKTLRAAQIIIDEGIGIPILLGDEATVTSTKDELGLSLRGVQIISPTRSPQFEDFVETYYQLRKRKGTSLLQARRDMSTRSYFGPMMVRQGDADVFVSGLTQYYPMAIRPMLRVMSDCTGGQTLAAAHLAINDDRLFLLSDTSVNIDPSRDQIVSIAESLHHLATKLGLDPRIALLSFSSMGSVVSLASNKMREATEQLWETHPDWMVDGELHADVAVLPELLHENYPFAKIQGGANCLVFPNLDAANIAFRLLRSLGGLTLIGPVLMGMDAPMHVLQRGASVDDIVNVATIGVIEAQARQNAVAGENS